MAIENRFNVLNSKRADLTGYSALVGESFSSRVDLLQSVIQGAHYPSLGRYKERLLAQYIRDYIPQRFSVGTGFVLFPHEDTDPSGGHENHDPLNQSTFSISNQCDILVYDSNQIPPVFRDDDFVVVRPESLRAIIEVKGALTLPELTSTLSSFISFGRQWRATQLFYRDNYQSLTPMPNLFLMAWGIKKGKTGSYVATPTALRERIVREYRNHVSSDELNGFPVLDSLLVYNECETLRTTWSKSNPEYLADGWATMDGRFTRFHEGTPVRDKDRTIASLLANLHHATEPEKFNRFFSYVDETRDNRLVNYEYAGFTPWFEGDAIPPFEPTILRINRPIALP
ncbi:MAG: DUF6602 domain-containing protein [Pirellulaceae bacterium]